MQEKQKILKFEVASLIFTLIFSFVSHFLFEWTNEFMFLAPFVPVNESVWEHGKLLFMPFLFFAIIEYAFIGENKNFIYAKSIPLIVSVPLMITIFYTYSGIIGTHNTVVDILMAVAIVVGMNVFSYKALISEKIKSHNWLLIIVAIIFILFIIFTLIPPKIPLFIANN